MLVSTRQTIIMLCSNFNSSLTFLISRAKREKTYNTNRKYKDKVKVLANAGALKKLTRAQKVVILYNRALFALQTNQLEQCRQLVAEMKSTYPASEQTILAEVGLLNRERKIGQAIELLDAHLKNVPSSPALLWLTLAQLYSGQGNTAMVCSVLDSLPSLSAHVGVVCTLAGLYTSLGKTAPAISVLDRVVSYLSQSTGSHSLLRSLMFHNAQYKLDHDRPQEAVATLEKLKAAYPNDLKVQARLIASYSKFDSRRAEKESQSLPKFSGGGGFNVDTLEQMPSFRHSQRQQQKPAVGSAKQTPAGTEGGGRERDKPRKKRKRKSKLPKNFDPDKKPDPERWQPLRERSYYRKGRKRGFSPLRGSQGTSHASASLTAQLDASWPKPTPSDDTTASPRKKQEVAMSPRAKPSQQVAQKKQQQQKKKKKKGGKW